MGIADRYDQAAIAATQRRAQAAPSCGPTLIVFFDINSSLQANLVAPFVIQKFELFDLRQCRADSGEVRHCRRLDRCSLASHRAPRTAGWVQQNETIAPPAEQGDAIASTIDPATLRTMG